MIAGCAPQRIRLVGTWRRAGSSINPRCCNFTNSVRAAMSLS